MIFRKKFYGRIEGVKQVSPGKFVASMGGKDFRIEGGRKLGGTSREWFLSGAVDGDIPCVSVADALRVLESL